MPSETRKQPKVVEIPKKRQRAPFVPTTGNPENGNYADWYECLSENNKLGERRVVPFIRDKE